MSDLVSRLPARPSLEQLRKQSKDLLRQFRSGDPAAIERFRVHFPKAASAAANFQSSLANAQFVIAREHGFENWAKLKQHVETLPLESLKRYEELARDVLQAYRTGESGAMQRVWAASGHMRSWKAMRKYMQLDLGKRPKSESDDVEISIDDDRARLGRSHRPNEGSETRRSERRRSDDRCRFGAHFPTRSRHRALSGIFSATDRFRPAVFVSHATVATPESFRLSNLGSRPGSVA